MNLMCHSSSDDDDDSDLEERLARMSIDKKNPAPTSGGAYPLDLLVAAEAARVSSSSDSELDSDDLSSSEDSSE